MYSSHCTDTITIRVVLTINRNNRFITMRYQNSRIRAPRDRYTPIKGIYGVSIEGVVQKRVSCYHALERDRERSIKRDIDICFYSFLLGVSGNRKRSGHHSRSAPIVAYHQLSCIMPVDMLRNSVYTIVLH